MELLQALHIRPGITAVIGSGGKTTFLQTVGTQLSRKHRVLLCTTTKLYPFPGLPLAHSRQDAAELSGHASLVCAGQVGEAGKLGPLEGPLGPLTRSFDYVLVEADGAAGRPCKAHASYEPVIPKGCNQVLCLVGALGFGQPIMAAAHRPEWFAQLAGITTEQQLTPEAAAEVLRKEHLFDRVLLNQVETAEQMEQAARFAAALGEPVLAGSLLQDRWTLLAPKLMESQQSMEV